MKTRRRSHVEVVLLAAVLSSLPLISPTSSTFPTSYQGCGCKKPRLFYLRGYYASRIGEDDSPLQLREATHWCSIRGILARTWDAWNYHLRLYLRVKAQPPDASRKERWERIERNIVRQELNHLNSLRLGGSLGRGKVYEDMIYKYWEETANSSGWQGSVEELQEKWTHNKIARRIAGLRERRRLQREETCFGLLYCLPLYDFLFDDTPPDTSPWTAASHHLSASSSASSSRSSVPLPATNHPGQTPVLSIDTALSDGVVVCEKEKSGGNGQVQSDARHAGNDVTPHLLISSLVLKEWNEDDESSDELSSKLMLSSSPAPTPRASRLPLHSTARNGNNRHGSSLLDALVPSADLDGAKSPADYSVEAQLLTGDACSSGQGREMLGTPSRNGFDSVVSILSIDE